MSHTPHTAKLLVKACRDAGYIEKVESFPVVGELNDGFIFISRDDNNGTFCVSKFFTGNVNEFLYMPFHETDNYDTALALYAAEYARAFMPVRGA